VGRAAILSLTIRVYLHPLLPPKSAKSHKIPKNELIAVQGHPRSSIMVPIETAHATCYSC